MTYSDDNEAMTLMIVEDDPAIRDVIKTMCELWNFEVIAFRDGFQAVEYLEKDPTPPPVPKVALLDIRMPGPWGHEISGKLRQHPTLSNIGIVLMTAYELPGSDEKQMIKTSGADRLIYKPLPAMDELLNLVQEVIRERKTIERSPEAPKPSEAKTEAKPQAEAPKPSEVKTEAKPQAEAPKPSEVKTEAKPQTEAPKPSEVKTEAKPQTEAPKPSEVKTEAKPQTEAPKPPEVKTEAKPQTEAPKLSEAKTEVKPQAEAPKPSEAKTEVKPQAKPSGVETKPQAKLDPTPED